LGGDGAKVHREKEGVVRDSQDIRGGRRKLKRKDKSKRTLGD